jgi:hypothetical protein
MPHIQTIRIALAYNALNLGAKMDLFVVRFSQEKYESWERIAKIEKTKIGRDTYYKITTASGYTTGAYTGEKVTVAMIEDD